MNLIKRNNGYYYIEFLDVSTKRIKRITTRTKNKKEAELYLIRFQTPDESSNACQTITLSVFQDEYVSFIGATHSKKYLTSIKLSFRQLQKHVGNQQIGNINNRIAQQFISTTYMRTKSSAHMYLRTLKAAFNRAIDWEYIEKNPFKKVVIPKMERPLPIFITEEQLNLILGKASNRTERDFFFLAFHTGMRLSEIINLRWEDVDLDKKFIYIRNNASFTTKSKKDRVIPINSKLFNMLVNRIQRMTNGREPIFVFEKVHGVKLHPEWTSKKFKDIIRELEMDDRIHFHTLRHSFASNLVQKGASIYIVKELMGHSDVSITQIYSHLQKEDLIETVKLLE